MNELVFNGLKPQDVKGAFTDFVETMFPTLGGIVELNENEYGRYMFADGTVFNQVELADALISYAWNHSFDKAMIINGVLFGDSGMLYYAMVKAMAETIKKERSRVEERKTYLMLDRNTNYVKIGSTCDLKGRLKMLSCGNPNLVIIATLDKNVETKLHRKCIDKKVEGEFYALSTEDIKQIITDYGFKDELICVE